MNRRNLLGALAASLATGGCANSVMSKTVSAAFDTTWRNADAFDADYAENLSFASIAVSVKNSRKALLVLARAEQDQLHWMSSDRGVLVTRDGRLVKTVGLPENLVGTEFLSPDFFEAGRLSAQGELSAKRLIDVAPGNRYGLLVEAKLVRNQAEGIRIGKRTYDTVRFTEHCFAPQISWKFTNSYWLDGQGTIWRSSQYATPGAGPMEIEITKPFRG